MLSRVALTVGARGILKGRASGVELPRHSREGGHWPCTSRLSGAALVLAAVQLEAETQPPPPPRRQIHRTEGGWSCSTIWNYVLKGDDATYLANFRCTRRQFDDLVGQLEAGAPYMVSRQGGRGNPTLFRPLRFKVAVCLYFLTQTGVTPKTCGDAASCGEATVRSYLDQFAAAVMLVLRPIYMPNTPPSAAQLDRVRSEFAARRGVPNVAEACDGTHVPIDTHESDYRNYKGWHSILTVAFVNSFHLFVSVDTGHAGRCGDNTVLKDNRHLAAIKSSEAARRAWLGPNGMIITDGGASDGDGVMFQGYSNPKTEQEHWLNFCHSSTRFFVEETFGRWKNRFRFLLHCAHGFGHKRLSQLIYTSAILHNMFTIHQQREGGPELSISDMSSDEGWQNFFDSFKATACPSCTRRGVAHCSHETRNRNIFGGCVGRKCSKPSSQRDELRDLLWSRLVSETEAWAQLDEAENSLGLDIAKIRARVAAGGY